MDSKEYNKYNGYNPYNTYEGYELAKETKKNEPKEERVSIRIDKKGKGHEKEKQNENIGFIGSNSTNKYSNPYDNNVYGEFTSKKEKRSSKNKKRSSNAPVPNPNQEVNDVDVTQAPLTPTNAVPVVLYPQQITTVPTVYYTTPVATPVAIQYVNSPTSAYQEGSNSNSSEAGLNKEKRESRKISYFADKENATESIIKSDDKEKELEEIMSELGMKPKSNEPNDLRSKLMRNQLFIYIAALILFIIIIVIYFIWPRLPDLSIVQFELQQPHGIQYKLPMDIEYRDDYIDLANVTSSDTDSFVQFNMVVHFDVKNNNYMPYKFNSLFIEYVLKDTAIVNNVLLGDSYINSISFGTRKTVHMTITTALKYAAKNMKNDNTFRVILDRCGITARGTDIDLDYKVSVKIPVVSKIYEPTYTKTTSFKCPFLTEEPYMIQEKKKDDEDKKHKDDDENDKESDKKDDGNNSSSKNDNNNNNHSNNSHHDSK